MVRRKKGRKKIVILIVALVAVAAYFIAKQAGWIGRVPLEEVSVEHPQMRTITEVISTNGRVRPVTEIKIAPEVSGEIVELRVKEGDHVRRGDLLIKIKPDTYQSMQERATASLNSAQSQLNQIQTQYTLAQQTFRRQEQLYGQKAISEADYQSALAQYEGLKAQVSSARFNIQSAEASLKEANENLYKTTIFAPSDGTISKLNVEIGERVVGTATMAGTDMLTMADLSEMEVRADVNENDIIRVELGDTTTVEIDAYVGRKFTGIVTRIANSAQSTGTLSSDQITNFEVRIYLLPESYADLVSNSGASPFRPGMSATVDIQTEQRHVLAVPVQAVTTRANLNSAAQATSTAGYKQEIVFVCTPDSLIVRQVNVTTGIQDRRYIEIKNPVGLDTTNQIVTAPFAAIAKKLSNGQQVTIKP